MAMKTFQAETMIEALQMVQQELGSDAIVLSVRDAQQRAGFWRRPGVEVVAMSQSDIANAAGQVKPDFVPAVSACFSPRSWWTRCTTTSWGTK